MIHIHLLHIVDEDNNGHFVYIQDFEKLMGTSGKHKGSYCKHCLSKFTSHERLSNHYKMGCYDVVGTLKFMPKEDQTLSNTPQRIMKNMPQWKLRVALNHSKK